MTASVLSTAENGLALNPDKSEVIVIGTGARNRKEGGISAVTLGDTLIAVSKTVKSLGVTLDETLSFKSTMFAKLLTSTLELCVISGSASMMKLHGQWLAWWSVHDSTIVTRSFMERPLETLARSKGWSTSCRGCQETWSHHASSGWSTMASNRVKNTIQSSVAAIQNCYHEETRVSRRSYQFPNCIEITPV